MYKLHVGFELDFSFRIFIVRFHNKQINVSVIYFKNRLLEGNKYSYI